MYVYLKSTNAVITNLDLKDNMEFCRIPLTSDFKMNPFQYRESSVSKPMFLVHAVMALAGHHVESTSTDTHRHAALQSLRQSLDKYNCAKHRDSIIDTIIILFSLDVGRVFTYVE